MFASRAALSPAVATLVATMLIGTVGYSLMVRNFPIATVAVYVAFASVGLLTATSFASLSSFGVEAWEYGIWHADALVLYAMSASLISMFVLLRANTKWLGVAVLALARPLFISVQSFHFQGWAKEEVAISLFIYTVFGLYFYQFGRVEFYRAGQALLAFVVIQPI